MNKKNNFVLLMILVILLIDWIKVIWIKKRDFINNKKGEREVIIVMRWVFKWMLNISVEMKYM